jgi:photosystem II stability/assembly factor-like uncharacterized protein
LPPEHGLIDLLAMPDLRETGRPTATRPEGPMNIRRSLHVLALAVIVAAVGPLTTKLAAQQVEQVDPALYQDMRWRMIGPHRGGRTKAVVGVPSQPGLFYTGYVNGGLWRSTDYGRTWTPIFDDQPTGSVGAVAVSASNPDIIYVGSGEGMQRPDLTVGDGIYRSDDAGATWTHLGLRDGQQIPQIIVDPDNPERLFVAVLGHPYGANEERGVFRSTDGGRSFAKVLYRGPDIGAAEVAFDPTDPQVIYAVLWEQRQGPWENAVFRGPGSGLFKSIDGGDTWRQIGGGLPTGEEGLGRIGIGIAPSLPNRMYAIVGSPTDMGGMYRSDDAGESWRRVQTDPRIWGRDGDFNEVKVDPTDPDVVYAANVVAWKSTDAGETFEAFRGAPGGDDYQRIWIDPTNPRVIAMAADQGTVITVNGGESWSSWYNQPTAQFYHVSTDFAFPYRVCGGQQESGSACVPSRGHSGQITFAEFAPVGVEEYGYVAPDPLDPNIYYGGRVSRFDRRTGDRQNVGPRPLRRDDYFVVRTQPVLFSPTDPRTLYYASNVLWKTRDGGKHWDQISPDLTRSDSLVPPNIGTYADEPEARAHHRGVIYTVAPSHVVGRWIWVGTDDGLIHVTRDGGRTWTDVTPEQIRDRSWSKISVMDASHTDTLTAYAAVSTLRLDDMRPHIYVTHDGGVTWERRVSGLPDFGFTNAVKEDPIRPGLLFTGTETQVHFSLDHGRSWSPLRLNMPATAIRDLVIKDDDLVVGTHGRSFWILDDITPLRQITAETSEEPSLLFEPAQAWRVRWNRWTDTPLPADEPTGESAPDGAILNYWIGEGVGGPAVLEIVDGAGRVARRFSSEDEPEPPLEGQNVPPLWIRPHQPLGATPGMHRFVWDLHYERPVGMRLRYPISAVPGRTPVEPRGPVAMPGEYTVRLTLGGATHEEMLVVKMDPRVQTGVGALQEQFDLSMAIRDAMAQREGALEAARERRADPDARLMAIGGELETLYRILQESDAEPLPRTVMLVHELVEELGRLVVG